MDRFVSTFTGKLDAKGRLSIPAPFRAVLAREGFQGLYVHPSLDLPTLDCGGGALLGEIDAMIASFPPLSPDRDALAMALLGASDLLKMDGEGRVMLPDALTTHAAIGGEVCLVGTGHKFQIWEPSRFRRRLVEARQQALALRNQRGSRSPAPAMPAPQQTGARE